MHKSQVDSIRQVTSNHRHGLTGYFWLVTSVLAFLLLPLSVNAQLAGGPLKQGLGWHTESVTDLQVKVLGGFVTQDRTWWAGQWQFNRRWNRLNLIESSTSRKLISIERNDSTYSRVNEQSSIFAFGKRLTIEQTAAGFTWRDREGNWIVYDADGYLLRYGDRNNVQVSLVYESKETQKRIGAVKDHHGFEVLTFEYHPTIWSQLIRARDYSGRSVEYQYSEHASLIAVIDVRGNPWSYTYDGNGGIFLATKTDPENRSVKYTYNAGGQLVKIEDEIGLRMEYDWSFDQSKKLLVTRETNGEGVVTEYHRTLDGKLTAEYRNGRLLREALNNVQAKIVTDNGGRATQYEYDLWGNVKRVTYADGSAVLYEYDPRYYAPTKITNANGVATELKADQIGNVVRIVEAVGTSVERVTDFVYDIFGQVISIRRNADSVSKEALASFTYDNKGNITTYKDADGNMALFADHDSMGNAGVITDPRGNTMEYKYDPAGSIVHEVSPLGKTQDYGRLHEYDRVGNQVKNTLPNGHQIKKTFDARNRLVAVSQVEGYSKRTRYNLANRVVSVTDEEGIELRTDFDSDGRVFKEIDGGKNETEYLYNEQTGLVEEIRYPTYVQTLTYDKLGRVVAETDHLSEGSKLARAFVYDALDNLIAEVDESNNSTFYVYDELNRLIEEIDSKGNSDHSIYDNRDNLVAYTNANGNRFLYEYSASDNLLYETAPLGEKQQWLYRDGLLYEHIDAKQQHIRFAYDDDGQLVSEERYVSAETNVVSSLVRYAYSKLGQLVSYDDGVSSANYAYDELGRLTAETVNFGGFSKAIGYTYYANNLKKTMTVPDGTVLRYEYTANRQISSIDIQGAGRIVYNAYLVDRPTKIIYPGGVTKTLKYDDRLLLRSSSVEKAIEPLVLTERAYSTDNVGNIVEMNSNFGKWTFRYDSLYRLVAADSPTLPEETYTYDPLGNRKTDSRVDGEWVYNKNEQLVAKGNVVFRYDANGSVVEKAVDGVKTQYTYNEIDRLETIVGSDGGELARYYYDPLGQRLNKTVAGRTSYFLYAEGNLIGEYNEQGGMIRAYGYLPDNAALAQPLYISTDNQTYYYDTNPLGTPLTAFDSDGRVTWNAEMDAFGAVIKKEHDSLTNNLRFPGQYYDDESGLHYNWFRYYDPGTGRYFSSDPIGLKGGANSYTYVDANPINRFDRDGLVDRTRKEGLRDSRIEEWRNQGMSEEEIRERLNKIARGDDEQYGTKKDRRWATQQQKDQGNRNTQKRKEMDRGPPEKGREGGGRRIPKYLRCLSVALDYWSVYTAMDNIRRCVKESCVCFDPGYQDCEFGEDAVRKQCEAEGRCI